MGKNVATYGNDREMLRSRISGMVDEAGSPGAFARKSGVNPGSLDYLLHHNGESSYLRRKYKIFKRNKRWRIDVEVPEEVFIQFRKILEITELSAAELLENMMDNYDVPEWWSAT